MVKAKKWILSKAYKGDPTLDNFKLVEEELPALKDGDIMIEALYFTVDPYMRVFPIEVGQSPVGQQVSKVIESKCQKYPVGTLLLAMVGWRDKTVLPYDQDNPYGKKFSCPKTILDIPNLGDFSPSLFLGVLGMPGMTAYFGLLEKCRPKPGEIVLINAAAGAVGSIAGQIAKIKGCTVIGSAGSKEKCDWLKEIGFDAVFNYKETSVEDALKKYAPDGVDCYFDNVGGEYTLTVISNMRNYGRVCCCGQISQYNATSSGPAHDIIHTIMLSELTVSGIMVYTYLDKFDSAKREMAQWIREGKLKFKETFREGFNKLPDSFLEIFKGTASGKIVVKA